MAKGKKIDGLENEDPQRVVEASVEHQVEKEPRVRSGVFGIVAILSSVTLLIVAIFSPTSDNSKITLVSDRAINVALTLISDEFIESGLFSPCGGVGSIKGISTSMLTVASGSWKKTVKIGVGTLNDNGDCIYVFKIMPPESFSGGEIKISARFPFGFSPVYKLNVGDEAPWSVARFSLPLD